MDGNKELFFIVSMAIFGYTKKIINNKQFSSRNRQLFRL